MASSGSVTRDGRHVDLGCVLLIQISQEDLADTSSTVDALAGYNLLASERANRDREVRFGERLVGYCGAFSGLSGNTSGGSATRDDHVHALRWQCNLGDSLEEWPTGCKRRSELLGEVLRNNKATEVASC